MLIANRYDDNGLVIPGVSFVWQVTGPSLGRINDIGYLTVEGEEGVYDGSVTVTGIWEGSRVSRTVSVRVVETPEADDFMIVEILPQRFHIDAGDRLQVWAVALNGLGELVSGTELRWSMTDPDAGAIDGSGIFVAGDTSGIYTEAVKVEAIVPGERGFVRAADFASVVINGERSPQHMEAVRVLPQSVVVGRGGRVLLVAQGVDGLGNPAENVLISWKATHEAAGEIDNHGSFIALGSPGEYPDALTVTAWQRVDGKTVAVSESVDVTVMGTLTQLQVRPAPATVAPGRTVHFSVIGRDENGIVLPGLVVIWEVPDSQIGTIDAFGNFTAGEVPGDYLEAIRAQVIQTLPKLKKRSEGGLENSTAAHSGGLNGDSRAGLRR